MTRLNRLMAALLRTIRHCGHVALTCLSCQRSDWADSLPNL